MTAITSTQDTQNRSTIYPPSPPISDLETDDASASASAIQENKIEIIIPEQKATDDMVDKSHPSAQAPKKTQLLLGNLPPKQAGFGNVLVSLFVLGMQSVLGLWVLGGGRLALLSGVGCRGLGFQIGLQDPTPEGKAWLDIGVVSDRVGCARTTY